MAAKTRKKRTVPGSNELITVVIVPIGGTPKEVCPRKGAIVEEVLRDAGFDPEVDVRANGEILERDDIVEDGDRLIISGEGKIEGGCI